MSERTTALVTGANKGIGYEIAVGLGKLGWRVGVGARDDARREAAVEKLQAEGVDAFGVPLDVTDDASVAAAAALIEKRTGRLDVLVNNAGVAHVEPLDDLAVDHWEEMIDVNLRGVLHGIAAALPVFRRQGFGHVVNVVSTSGLRIVPEQAVYAATKNAVRTVSEALRQEAGPHLRVTAVSPGMTSTELIAASGADPAAAERGQARMDEIGLPAEAVARTIAFAIEQPAEVDVGEIVVRPTAQG